MKMERNENILYKRKKEWTKWVREQEGGGESIRRGRGRGGEWEGSREGEDEREGRRNMC